MSDRSTMVSHHDPATARWIAGDRNGAMTMAFRAERHTMLSIARRIGGEDVATDVAQDAFLRVWRNPERFDPDRGTLGQYLRLVTRGTAIDHLRSRVSRVRNEDRATANSDAGLLDALHELVAREVSARVVAAMSCLRPEERRALNLAFYQRLTYRQIATLDDLPEGTVKSRIRAGMKRLRMELRELGREEFTVDDD